MFFIASIECTGFSMNHIMLQSRFQLACVDMTQRVKWINSPVNLIHCVCVCVCVCVRACVHACMLHCKQCYILDPFPVWTWPRRGQQCLWVNSPVDLIVCVCVCVCACVCLASIRKQIVEWGDPHTDGLVALAYVIKYPHMGTLSFSYTMFVCVIHVWSFA